MHKYKTRLFLVRNSITLKRCLLLRTPERQQNLAKKSTLRTVKSFVLP